MSTPHLVFLMNIHPSPPHRAPCGTPPAPPRRPDTSAVWRFGCIISKALYAATYADWRFGASSDGELPVLFGVSDTSFPKPYMQIPVLLGASVPHLSKPYIQIPVVLAASANGRSPDTSALWCFGASFFNACVVLCVCLSCPVPSVFPPVWSCVCVFLAPPLSTSAIYVLSSMLLNPRLPPPSTRVIYVLSSMLYHRRVYSIVLLMIWEGGECAGTMGPAALELDPTPPHPTPQQQQQQQLAVPEGR